MFRSSLTQTGVQLYGFLSLGHFRGRRRLAEVKKLLTIPSVFVKFAVSSIKHQRVDRMTIRDKRLDAFKAISLDLSFLPPKQTGFQMNV